MCERTWVQVLCMPFMCYLKGVREGFGKLPLVCDFESENSERICGVYMNRRRNWKGIQRRIIGDQAGIHSKQLQFKLRKTRLGELMLFCGVCGFQRWDRLAALP